MRTRRLGFIAVNVAEQVLVYMPVTTDLSTWYRGVSTLSLLVVVALAGWGYWAACGRRPLNTVAGSA